MPERERRRLTDAAIAKLRPGAREYTVWDSDAPRLGVRVRPTGGKSYVLLCRAAGGSKRISLGPVEIMNVADARGECLARRARPEPEREAGAIAPLLREFVEGEWTEAHFGRYRPATKTGYRSLLTGRILPSFGSKPVDRIAPLQVRKWFDKYSRTAPINANRALELFRQIMNFAIARGYIDTNPTHGIVRNRRQPLSRFLSREEIAGCTSFSTPSMEKATGSRRTSSGSCCSPDAAGARWSACAGLRSRTTCWCSPKARPGPGRSR